MTAELTAADREALVGVLADHQWHHTRTTHCACGFRTPLAQLAVEGYLRHVADQQTDAVAAIVTAHTDTLRARLAACEALADEWESTLAAFCAQHGVQYEARCNGCDGAEGANTSRAADAAELRAAIGGKP